MRVGIVSTGSPEDIRTWSGIPYYVTAALRDAGVEVHGIDTGEARYGRARYWRGRLDHARGRTNRSDLYPVVLNDYARSVERQIKAAEVDVVLGMNMLVLARVSTATPLTLWTDATFSRLIDFYPEFVRLPTRQRELGLASDRAAMSRCSAVFFASQWAADSAVAEVGLPRERAVVVPFGASLSRPPSRSSVENAISGRNNAICRLVMIGVDWERKGARVAVSAAAELRRAGIETVLTIIGMIPPQSEVPPYVTCVPYIDKRTSSGASFIDRTLLEAHFQLLPSSAECFGIAVAEAAAYGVPTVANDVGGLAEAVRSDANGVLLPPHSSGEVYAAVIRPLFEDQARYRQLAASARLDYEQRLNWPTSIAAVLRRLRQITNRTASPAMMASPDGRR